MLGAMKSDTPESFDGKFVLLFPVSGEPLSIQFFRIRLPESSLVESVSDEYWKVAAIALSNNG